MAAIHADGAKIMRNLTVEIDTRHLQREMFGFLDWRRRLAMLLFRVGVAVLRCGFELK